MSEALYILAGRDEMTLWHAALWIDFGLFVTRPVWRLWRASRRHPLRASSWPVLSATSLVSGYMGVAVMVNALLLGRVLDGARPGLGEGAAGLALPMMLGLAAGLWVFWLLARLCHQGAGWSWTWALVLCGGLHMGCLVAASLGASHPAGTIDPGPLALPIAGLLLAIAVVLVWRVLGGVDSGRGRAPAR